MTVIFVQYKVLCFHSLNKHTLIFIPNSFTEMRPVTLNVAAINKTVRYSFLPFFPPLFDASAISFSKQTPTLTP